MTTATLLRPVDENCTADERNPNSCCSPLPRYTLGVDPGARFTGIVTYDNATDQVVGRATAVTVKTLVDVIDAALAVWRPGYVVIERPFNRFSCETFGLTWAMIGVVWAMVQYSDLTMFFTSPRAGNKALGLPYKPKPTDAEKLEIGKRWGLEDQHQTSALAAVLAWRNGDAELCSSIGETKASKARDAARGSRSTSVGKSPKSSKRAPTKESPGA